MFYIIITHKAEEADMKIKIYQVVLLLVLTIILVSGYLTARHLLNLPFRSTNDELHRMESSLTLDFLIPGGVYVDEKMTIGEVIKLRINKTTPRYKKAAEVLSELIPLKYRYLADLLLFLFWSFLFITFLRVFTFLSYSRSLRASFFLGGVFYYYMPDFTPGKLDDSLFIAVPSFVILIRFFMIRRKKRGLKKKKLSGFDSSPKA